MVEKETEVIINLGNRFVVTHRQLGWRSKDETFSTLCDLVPLFDNARRSKRFPLLFSLRVRENDWPTLVL